MKEESVDSLKVIPSKEIDDAVSAVFDVKEKSVLTVLGHLLLSHRQFEDAVSVYECIRKIDPKDKYVIRALIYLYIEQSKTMEALELLDSYKELELNADDADHLSGLLESRALWESGREHDARECFREYLEKSSVVK